MDRQPWSRRTAADATLMELKWSNKAVSNSAHLYDFLALVNKQAAAHAAQSLVKAPEILLIDSRLGEQLFLFKPREVRRILVGQ